MDVCNCQTLTATPAEPGELPTELDEENARRKHLVAELRLDKEMLRSVITKNGWSSPAVRK